MQPIFIVGQYKCGSTWLLDILSAHPQTVGVAEIDIVKAVCDFRGRTYSLAPLRDRLYRVFDGSGWCAYHDGTQWHYDDVVSRFERNELIESSPGDLSRSQMFMNLAPEVALTLYRRITNAQHPHEAMNAFLEAVCAGGGDATHVVLKGCDQIAVFDALQEWQPQAKKVVITRDGRDAALSALHFTRLMNEMGAPCRDDPNRDYIDFLKSWSHRADMIARHSARGALWIIRYEDLSRDFAATIGPLLEWLGLDHSGPVIEAIRERASFETVTGRPRGTEAKHTVRKGAVGEWIEVLTAEDKSKAWAVAKRQLSMLGYTANGDFSELPRKTAPYLTPNGTRGAVRSVMPPSCAYNGGTVEFRCNICGQHNVTQWNNIGRELRSCVQCRSTVRFRSVIHVLSQELLEKDLPLVDWPTNRELRGIGMSDSKVYAVPLARKVNYCNTYYHSEPRLDITSIPSEMEGTLDFILASDVFQYIAPPISVAFANLRRLLKPTGVVVLTVAYNTDGTTVEHYPELYQYTIEKAGDRCVVINTTKDGRRQMFHNPTFGRGGTALEMRVFSETSLIEEFENAGFNRVSVNYEECAEHGIWWEEACSLPISARVE
jgi:SAM-dependent methyltransferase